MQDLLLARKLFAGGWAAALARQSDTLALLQTTECATLSIQVLDIRTFNPPAMVTWVVFSFLIRYFISLSRRS